MMRPKGRLCRRLRRRLFVVVVGFVVIVREALSMCGTVRIFIVSVVVADVVQLS